MAILSPPLMGADLEDQVAALFQAAGYFVEKNIVDAQPSTILELDVVATKYSGGRPEPCLVEVKSGGWGFTDIFKVSGWMTYLGIKRGAFFTTTRHAGPVELVSEKACSLGISYMFEPSMEFASVVDQFSKAGFVPPRSEAAIDIWRLSATAERDLAKVLKTSKVAPRSRSAAWEYFQLINNGVFLEKDIGTRAQLLYEAYQKHPKLTGAAAAEIASFPFDPRSPMAADSVFREALVEGKHPLMQACMYLEHRARLAILKAAIDILSTSGVGGLALPSLPANFTQALGRLACHPHFRQYPYLWQTFLWSWGGFVLADKLDEEFRALSVETGVPEDEVPGSLALLDELFPISGEQSWTTDLPGTSLRIVKLVPAPFRRVGTAACLSRYEADDFGALDCSGNTQKVLQQWSAGA